MDRPSRGFFLLLLATVLGSSGFAQAPVHLVTVSAFFMAWTEVTVGQFRRFAEATGYQTTAERTRSGLVVNLLASEPIPIFEYRPDANWRTPYYAQDKGFPVTMVSLSDAQHYCNWLSQPRAGGPRPPRKAGGLSVGHLGLRRPLVSPGQRERVV